VIILNWSALILTGQ